MSGGRAQWQAVLDAFWRDFKPRTSEVMEQQPSAITAELDQFLAPYLFPKRRTGRTRASARIAARASWRCAAAGSVRSSPAPTTRSANIPAASRRVAKARVRTAARKRLVRIPKPACPSSASRGGSAPISSWARARTPSALRSPGCRSRPGMGAQTAQPAAHHRQPPGNGRADHRVDRALRPLSGACGQICAADLDRRCVRNGHERRRGQAGRGGGGWRARRAHRVARTAQDTGQASAHRGGDQADGGALWPMSPMVRPMRPSQDGRQGPADAGRSRAVDRRAGGGRSGAQETGEEGGGEKAPAKKAADKTTTEKAPAKRLRPRKPLPRKLWRRRRAKPESNLIP